jgi:hypothetical protein
MAMKKDVTKKPDRPNIVGETRIETPRTANPRIFAKNQTKNCLLEFPNFCDMHFFPWFHSIIKVTEYD